MKSANWISATGRIPFTERPMAEPAIRLSASGVSITLEGPNSSWRPCVTRNTPPARPSWMACKRFFSAIFLALRVDAFERLFGIGERRLFGVVARLGDLGFDLGRQLLFLLVVQNPVLLEILLETDYRVLQAPLLDLLALAIPSVVVVGGVGGQAVGPGLDQGRTLAPACPVYGLFRRLVDREDVVAVHLDPREVVTLGPSGDRARHLQRRGDGDGVDVVLDKEDDGQVVDAGEVHRLVPVALAGRGLAAAGQHHPILAAHLERQST